MRLGIISDVHANLHALDACLTALGAERIDSLLCCGDLVGYGAHPNECVERALSVTSSCVAGNHDLIALGRLSTDRCVPLARDSLDWTARVLTGPSRESLAALPINAVAGNSVVLAHGSIDDPQRYVPTAAAAGEQLRRLGETHPSVKLLVLGHTHQQLAVGERSGQMLRGRPGTVALARDERYLLNPGSVGQARDRRALVRYLVLDLEVSTATFRAIPYDTEGARAALAERGLPPDSCHQPPTARRRARALARRLRRLAPRRR